VTGFCELGNEQLCFENVGEYLDWLKNYLLLTEDFVTRSYLVYRLYIYMYILHIYISNNT
jgi:hypothetical protein